MVCDNRDALTCFCGSTQVVVGYEPVSHDQVSWYVECKDCKSCVAQVYYSIEQHKAEAEIIKAWLLACSHLDG